MKTTKKTRPTPSTLAINPPQAPMTARGYDALLAAAVQSIAERVAAGGEDATLKASTFAIEAIITEAYPEEAARITAARAAFCDIDDLLWAVSETAFDVGVAYGRRLAETAR